MQHIFFLPTKCRHVFLLLLIFFTWHILAASADYFLVPPVERYVVFTNSWKLSKTFDAYDQITVNHNGKTCVWKIDRFLLADRTDSNTICTGTSDTFTKNYLDKLSVLPSDSEIELEVVLPKASSSLVVAGIWSFEFNEHWERAIQQGSRILNLSAEKVRALGSAEGYKAKLMEYSKEQWSKLQLGSSNSSAGHYKDRL